jgi:hypothetical protein
MKTAIVADRLQHDIVFLNAPKRMIFQNSDNTTPKQPRIIPADAVSLLRLQAIIFTPTQRKTCRGFLR